MTRRLPVLTAIAAVLALPAAAPAATVETKDAFCPKGCFETGFIAFAAEPGEVNDVTVSFDGSGTVLRDAGAVVTPADGGCVALDAHAVRCVVTGPSSTIVSLGDEDDRARGEVSAVLLGGDGADVLHLGPSAFDGSAEGGSGDDDLTADTSGGLDGGEGNDVLRGGPRRQALDGGAGDDRLTGARGDDELTPGPGADVVDAGPGSDRFVHGDRVEPLVLSLAEGRGDEDPEVRGIEDVSGGAGSDRITGDGGPNRLGGDLGDDVVDGGAGADAIGGGGGTDAVAGGAGRDQLSGGDGAEVTQGAEGPDGDDIVSGGPGRDRLHGSPGADELRCGGARDTVSGAQADRLAGEGGGGTHCEELQLGRRGCIGLGAPALDGGDLVLRNACARYSHVPERRRVVLRDCAGAVLAAGWMRDRRKPVPLELTGAGRAAYTAGAVVEARLVAGRRASVNRAPLVALAAAGG